MVEFRATGEAYRYFDVELAEWQGFLEAESKGTYLNCVFKQKEHPYERTGEPVRFSGRKLQDLPLEWVEPFVPRKGMQRVPTEDRVREATA